MNEALIEQLSIKLGTTVEHLWGVLIKQAPISSTCDLIAILLFAVALIWSFRFIKSKTRELDDEGATAVVWTAYALVAGITVIITLVTIPTTLSGFVNPEYWALKQLITKGG